MILAIFISALLLGLASSLHCIGMCGPLIMSVPVQHLPQHKKIWGILLYQFGRISTYMIMGVLAGVIGWRIGIAGWQQVFSVLMGMAILFFLLSQVFFKKIKGWAWFNQKITKLISWSMRRHSFSGMYMMGVANGLLPCGMVYIAISGAMASGSILNAMVFMFVFGLGTLPALFSLAFWGTRLSWQNRQNMRKLVPYIVGLTAILLIIRGLNLNIPYMSPFISERSADTVSCH
ncbi:sulfite exporter TauE/SafE family protein [Sediminibacterium sp.]|uniref:sulfite exporter TauE/SafE family protein n=1 Tax=Sediminibacterium sp. TaxID=1917865 RepID=UPI0025D89530|nr:sulfite exporter TauE/SafE family protein [Sediminibacterium sp.]MBW0179090.1 sulfite exporter TauE/SafE family protein [Sediminibacterium sp.]